MSMRDRQLHGLLRRRAGGAGVQNFVTKEILSHQFKNLIPKATVVAPLRHAILCRFSLCRFSRKPHFCPTRMFGEFRLLVSPSETSKLRVSE